MANGSIFPSARACLSAGNMRFYIMMNPPASRRKIVAIRLMPIACGFTVLIGVAAFSENLAMALALAMIGFATVSMLVAVVRKH